MPATPRARSFKNKPTFIRRSFMASDSSYHSGTLHSHCSRQEQYDELNDLLNRLVQDESQDSPLPEKLPITTSNKAPENLAGSYSSQNKLLSNELDAETWWKKVKNAVPFRSKEDVRMSIVETSLFDTTIPVPMRKDTPSGAQNRRRRVKNEPSLQDGQPAPKSKVESPTIEIDRSSPDLISGVSKLKVEVFIHGNVLTLPSPTIVNVTFDSDSTRLQDQILSSLGVQDNNNEFVLLPRFKGQLYIGENKIPFFIETSYKSGKSPQLSLWRIGNSSERYLEKTDSKMASDTRLSSTDNLICGSLPEEQVSLSSTDNNYRKKLSELKELPDSLNLNVVLLEEKGFAKEAEVSVFFPTRGSLVRKKLYQAIGVTNPLQYCVRNFHSSEDLNDKLLLEYIMCRRLRCVYKSEEPQNPLIVANSSLPEEQISSFKNRLIGNESNPKENFNSYENRTNPPPNSLPDLPPQKRITEGKPQKKIIAFSEYQDSRSNASFSESHASFSSAFNVPRPKNSIPSRFRRVFENFRNSFLPGISRDSEESQSPFTIRDSQILKDSHNLASWSNEVYESHTSSLSNKRMRWVKGDIIGKGSFGSVYSAYDLSTSRIMAVKEMHIKGKTILLRGDHKSMKREQVEMIFREIELMKELSHENIIQYYGYENKQDSYFIFMEYVSGGTLSQLIVKAGSLPNGLVHSFLKELLCGLMYLHQHQIIHRDLKSPNILINNEGHIKIGDFGLSKKSRGKGGAYKTHKKMTFRGTPFWMAPEVTQQQGYSAKVDIWSLGCIVVEMITGARPWSHQNVVSVIFQLGQNIAPPYRLDDTEHYHLKSLIEQCFIITPAQRPSASQLLHHEYFQEPFEPVNFQQFVQQYVVAT